MNIIGRQCPACHGSCGTDTEPCAECGASGVTEEAVEETAEDEENSL